MDRLNQLRGKAGGSRDSTLDTSASPSEAYMTANESSKYFSLTEDNSSFDITPTKDVSLASAVETEKNITENDQLISNLSPIAKKKDPLGDYKIGKQIEAANILSGGVDIFDDNDNSYDGDELVIDDNAEIDDKSNPEFKLIENTDSPFQKTEEIAEGMDNEPAIASKDTEVVLQIDGKNVNAIDIGNGLYLYRKAGEEELAAVQIVADDQDQPTFKFLKVRENAEGNLEVYEEIEIEVPKEVPTQCENSENASHVPIKDINKIISEPVCNKVPEKINPQQEIKPIAGTSDNDDLNKVILSETKSEINLNGKMMKYNETRKSPVIHSTPNKEGIPLTKTMVDMQLHPSRPLDKVKTIEVHTDNIKQKVMDLQPKNRDFTDDQKSDLITTSIEIKKPVKILDNDRESKEEDKEGDVQILIKKQQESDTLEIKSQSTKNLKQYKHVLIKNNADDRNEDKFENTEDKQENVSKNIMRPEKPKTEKPTTGTLLTEEKREDLREEIDNVKNQKDRTDLIEKANNIAMSDPAISSSKIKIDSCLPNLKENLKSKQIVDTNVILEMKSETVKENKSILEQKPNLKEKEQETKTAAQNVAVSGSKGIGPKVSEEPNSRKDSSKESFFTDVKNVMSEVSTTIIATEGNNKTNATENLLTTPKILQQIPPTKIEMDSKVDPKIQESVVLAAFVNKCESKIQDIERNKTSKPDEIVLKDNSIFEVIENSESNWLSEVDVFKNIETSKSTTKLLEQEKSVLSDVAKDKLIIEKESTVNKPASTLKEPVAIGKIVPEKIENTDSNQQEFVLQLESIQTASNLKKQTQTKTEFKTNKLPSTVPQRKPEFSKIPCSTAEKKPIINNNAAVPFGQWTSANRQEFLNKIKEVKVPVNISNTKSISKPNDLNRRDVLQKIDSQRQSSNAASKTHDLAKLNIKNETPTFINKPSTNQPKIVQESKALLKVEGQTTKANPVLPKKVEKLVSGENSHKTHSVSTVTSTYTAKSEVPNRNEFNNQDLIDKTVEGIINRAVSAKHHDPIVNRPKESMKTQTTFAASFKSRDSKPSILDAIEMKMNELHGIPFVERPPNELPKVYNRDIKTYGKADNTKLPTSKVNQIPSLLPVTKYQQKLVKEDVIDLDSEEEVIEHEPITGDIDLPKKHITSKQSNTSAETNMAQIGSDSSKKESIITEKDFDKFVRRNSITYENCLTVNIEKNKNCNIVQGLVQKDTADKIRKKEITESKISSPKQNPADSHHLANKMQFTSKLVPVGEDAFNKNYHSKLQLAYQTALTTKRQMEAPITILEDKPVKVVFMDSNTNFQPCQLNVQGQNLSPSKKPLMPKGSEFITISTCDPVDSELLDTVEDIKPQDEKKCNKTKHQRKQVLTPVETPELELIVPGDLGIEVSPKKKKRIDDIKTDKNPRNLAPKKSYLLGRNTHLENPSTQDLNKEASTKLIEEKKDIIISHNDTASAIDNLVKAAELIENQSGNFKANADVPTTDAAATITPVKRGRGRPRKYPLPDSAPDNSKSPSPQKKPRLIAPKEKSQERQSSNEDNSNDSSDLGIVRENWTMGKINEKIVCPICNKLFRSENVVFKHVKHCTGPSPNRSDSDKRSSHRSRLSHDSKSMDSKMDDTDGETDSVNSKKNTAKKRKSKELSPDGKEDIIVIEDTPIKSKVEKRSVEPKQHEPRKATKTKAEYKVSTLSCEHCGKTFRQLSYLASHKLLHTKDNLKSEAQVNEKTVFSCEVCKKQFRKLHHLVQHRLIHNPSNIPKSSRKSSSEQEVENKTSKYKETKRAVDQSAAFRCEPCDKSFRKLHHLVEHRETHDGINRQKSTPTTQNNEKVMQNPPPPPQCDICKKSFRKLHHLIEHKEQHLETSSEMSDDKSVKSALSTKDIIHECSLCYMVFPNEHSLNKHSVFCQKKKRQSAKQAKPMDETVAECTETPIEKETSTLELIIPTSCEVINTEFPKNNSDNTEKLPEVEMSVDITETTVERANDLEVNNSMLLEAPKSRDLDNLTSSLETVKIPLSEVPQKLKTMEDIFEAEPKNTADISKKKALSKGAPAVKRRKSNLPLARIKESIALESSDDDDVRYMLNPKYKDSPLKPDTDESSEGRLFMKVKAKKRNSLQFERPNSKDLIKRRTSLQNLARVPRTKTKITESTAYPPQPNIFNSVKSESIDSDDSDVKYSFPDEVPQPTNSVKPPKEKRQSIAEKVQKTESEKTPKEKRKSLADKRKTLSGIARKKSLGKTKLVKQIEKPAPVKEIKRRRAEVEHRCDCGQLFSSAALLSRHTSLAHTPPRVRRRRTASPPAPSIPPTRKSTNKSTDSRKSSVRSDTDNTIPSKAKPGRPPGKTSTRTPVRKSMKVEPKSASSSGLQSSRKMAAHRGVPVPEKMRKALEKLK